jgi:hypothetical protein
VLAIIVLPRKPCFSLFFFCSFRVWTVLDVRLLLAFVVLCSLMYVLFDIFRQKCVCACVCVRVNLFLLGWGGMPGLFPVWFAGTCSVRDPWPAT